MKAYLFALSMLAATFVLAGCESDLPPTPSQVPNKLERGVTGQGTLYEPDRTSDPMIREESRVGN
jgi:hypothetical protein